MQKPKSKVALVTGGASGLGKAIAHRLASDGAGVVITDIQRDLGEATAAAGGYTFLEQDVTDEARWPQIVQEVEARFGRLNILVNNAGIVGPADAVNPENTRFADWRKIFAINVDSVFLGCRAAIPAMKRAGGGSIVNISSIAAVRATPHCTAYGASKAAVRQLTKSVAQHCAQEKLNIRCNSVHPGFVLTPLWEKGAADMARQLGISVEDALQKIVADTQAGIPLGDFTLPEDIAAAVSFLASEDARHITGTKLIVDGGVVYCDTYRASSKNIASPVRPEVNRSEKSK